MGRDEYMVEDSHSFLGSTGLFGRSGKPGGGDEMRRRVVSICSQYKVKADNFITLN